VGKNRCGFEKLERGFNPDCGHAPSASRSAPPAIKD
jgi:hypothetical protein